MNKSIVKQPHLNNLGLLASLPPWLWVVVLPFISIVIVCSCLIGFAVVGADDPVKDDYYKQGRMINLQFEAQKRAEEMGIIGVLRLDFSQKQISFDVQTKTQELPITDHILRLQLLHPVSAAKDLQLQLGFSQLNTANIQSSDSDLSGNSVLDDTAVQAGGANLIGESIKRFIAPWPKHLGEQGLAGRWYIQIDNEINVEEKSQHNSLWRLKSEFNTSDSSHLIISALPTL